MKQWDVTRDIEEDIETLTTLAEVAQAKEEGEKIGQEVEVTIVAQEETSEEIVALKVELIDLILLQRTKIMSLMH